MCGCFRLAAGVGAVAALCVRVVCVRAPTACPPSCCCHTQQAPQKKARRLARAAKAAAVAPRPVDKLRPVVRCQTARYNRRVRAGRGFTLEELKQAGINRQLAKTIGIAVDARRTNRSVATLMANVDRLKQYKAQLILFPRKSYVGRLGRVVLTPVAAGAVGRLCPALTRVSLHVCPTVARSAPATRPRSRPPRPPRTLWPSCSRLPSPPRPWRPPTWRLPATRCVCAPCADVMPRG